MKEVEDCFSKVKNNYLKFLKKEKIFIKSKKIKINNLKKKLYTNLILDRKKI